MSQGLAEQKFIPGEAVRVLTPDVTCSGQKGIVVGHFTDPALQQIPEVYQHYQVVVHDPEHPQADAGSDALIVATVPEEELENW